MAGKSEVEPQAVSLLSWAGPRTVVVPRTDQGFGFTLRHFIVYPPESAVEDQSQGEEENENDGEGRRHKRTKLSSLEAMDTIFVKNVKEDSPAHQAGLNTGDRIVSVNGESITGKSYSQVITLIQSSDASLKLLVVPKDEDILQMAYHPQAQESLCGSCGSLVDSDSTSGVNSGPYATTFSSNENIYSEKEARHETKVSITLRDGKSYSHDQDATETKGPPKLKSYSLFGPGPTPYREPLKIDDSVNKGFSTRERNLEYQRPSSLDSSSKMSSISCSIPAKKSYSFGVSFFPPKASDTKSSSSDNLSQNGVHRFSKENVQGSESRPRRLGYEHRQPSFDNESDSSRSKESLTRSHDRLISDSKPPPPYSPSYRPACTDSTSYIISRSHTTSSLASAGNSQSQSPYRSRTDYNPCARRGSDTLDFKSDHHSVRHYVPVVSESALGKGTKFSSSVDNIDARTSRYQSQRSWQPSVSTSRIREQTSPDSQMRTFVVRIPVGDRQYRHSPEHGSDSQAQVGGHRRGSGTTFALTRSPVSTHIEITKGPVKPIVSHRKYQFESGRNDNNSPGISFNRYKTELGKITSLKKFESVATRAAAFENKLETSEPEELQEEIQVMPSPQPAIKVRKISTERYTPPVSTEKALRPSALTNYQEAAPIRIYVSPGSSSAPASPIVEIVPVFHDPPSIPVGSMTRDSSPRPCSYTRGEDVIDGPYPQARVVQENIHGNRPVRKTSYLSAVNAPASRYSQASSSHDDDETPPNSPDSPTHIPQGLSSSINLGTSSNSTGVLSSFNTVSAVMSSGDGNVMISSVDSAPVSSSTYSGSATDLTVSAPSVVMRSKTIASPEEEAVKLHRRTSYLMATARDRSNQIPLEKSFSPPPPIAEVQTTPARNQSLKKLKNFFGEKVKTPSIREATENRAAPDSPLPDIVKEGWLLCKTAVTDGKKSSDRSWKEVWAVLRGHCLFLCKEKRENTSGSFSFDDKPISIKSCLVDIKYDYVKKKKQVFRLTTYNGSEYLFQADDHGSMISWIEAINTNNNPDCDDQGVGSADLISRKSSQAELTTNTKTSPQTSHKATKKLAGLSFKTKSSSPSLRRKKTANEKEDSGKVKSWKGRMMKGFKKQHDDGGGLSALCEPEGDECMKSAFGVSLDQCMPSPNNEYVPLIVELCTQIVEVRGLEVVGVYRVPGNSVAVTNMQEEFNKGFENVNIDNEKWLDVNVISSLLKAFFRKLPEPLVTNACYSRFIEANRIENPEKRMLKLKRLLHTLPEHHFETFKRMAEHLNRVAAFGHINKMDAKNLAIMFGPTLIRKTNEDTFSMVSDMSDQCRIVESIILHFEWFFSSWEDDHTVPLEEVTGVPLASDVSRVPRDDDEDADSAINTREIVSSIISAANRKLRNKDQQKSMDSLDFEPAFNERNIDAEIGRRQTQSSSISKSRSTLNSITSSRSISEEFLDRKQSTSTVKSLAQSTTDDAEFRDWEYIDEKPESVPTQKSYIGRGFTRHYSDESLLDRNDELELSHGLNSSWSLSRDTLDRLRRIEIEARALREREEQRQHDMEKRRFEQQRIEQELQRTKHELEIEESHSVEDLLNWKSDLTSHRMFDIASKADSTSMTSSYSNSSVGMGECHISHPSPVHRRFPSSSDSSSGTSALNIHLESRAYGKKQGSKQENQAPGGGKYFVSIANTRGRGRGRNGARGVLQGSLDSLAPRFSRTGSLEDILDSNGHIHVKPSRTHHQSKKAKESKRDSKHESGDKQKRHYGSLSRSSTLRHGSLDSLIDLHDKHDNRASWASSDSEDGSDLLTSLTTTFDQKLQILLNPKYKLGGSRRGIKVDGSSSANNLTDAAEDKDADVEKTASSLSSQLAVAVPSAQVVNPSVHTLATGDFSRDKIFRDPSLHRSSKPEAKIGIASRFERGSQIPVSLNSQTVLAVNPSIAQRKPLTDFKPFNVKLSPKADQVPGVVLTQPKKLDTKPICKSDFRPISKSEKTEVNATLARLSREEKYLSGKESSKQAAAVLLESQDLKTRSESPPNEKRRNRRSKRRHTVGGTNDLEHFKALITVTGTKENEPESKISAWEQLQPAVKGGTLTENRSLLSWIQKERLRGSTPDLTSDYKE